MQRKPSWIRAKLPSGEGYQAIRSNIEKHGLHTVCQEASCPNIGDCWSRGTATIMILGDICTRSCGFCNVKTGKPEIPDYDEPINVGKSIALMGLRHIVITCVDRDDLPDGGAQLCNDGKRQRNHIGQFLFGAQHVFVLTGPGHRVTGR